MIKLDSNLRRYLLIEHVIGAAFVNFVLNALIAWLAFRSLDIIPLWGQQSIGGDLIGTVIVLSVLTALIATRIVRWHIRLGRVARLEPSGFVTTPPDRLVVRGLMLAALGLVTFTPLLLAILAICGVREMELRTFVLFKGAYAAVLAALVQPVIALWALVERPR